MNWKTILVKFSGEDCGSDQQSIAMSQVEILASEIIDAVAAGVRVGVVVGAGNIFRAGYARGTSLTRTTADEMGMLGTLLNALAIRDALEARGQKAIMFSARSVDGQRTFSSDEARKALADGYVCIFGGGIGSEYFSTDTAAVLRALQIQADIVLKATHVDGVYASDPKKDPSAERFSRISLAEVLRRELGVMDLAAFALCVANSMSIGVYQHTPGALGALVRGEREVGTLVHP